MKCSVCGHDNASINRFCGMCGAILERRPAVAAANVLPIRPLESPGSTASQPKETLAPPPAPAAAEPLQPGLREPAAAEPPATTFTLFGETQTMQPAGESYATPSFLGLGDEPPSGHYLLDEEEEESHGGRNWLLLAVLVLVAALAVMQWRSNADVRALGGRTLAALQDTLSGLNRPATPVPAAKEPTAAAHDETATQTTSAAQTPSPTTTTDQTTSQANPGEAAKSENGSPNAAGAQRPETAASDRPRQQAKLGDRPGRPEPYRNKPKAAAEQARAKPSAAKASSARSGDAEAAQLYASAQQSLHGGARNCNNALSSLRSSAERGYARAAAQLGALYATGNCAPFDRVQAYQWFTRAMDADPANRYLRQNRAMLLREMSAEERRQVQ